ncbi:MAG: TolC family protein [Bacteroidota bacterium]|nr:TolC family protein [Bacteroidota bacterium]
MKRRNIILILVMFPFLAAGIKVHAQGISGNEILVLDTAVSRVLKTHPTIREAEEAIRVADTRIQLARSAYLPVISGNAGYSHIGPVPDITIPRLGEFKMAPADNYSATADLNETIWDFGKTSHNVDIAKANKELTFQSLEATRKKLEMMTISVYFTLSFLDEAIRIKDEEIRNLNDHLEYARKKKETGSGTDYDILSTQVRISAAENQRTDLLAQEQYQNTLLNMLMGQEAGRKNTVSKEILTPDLSANADSLIRFSTDHREEMIMARQSEKIAGLQYDLVKVKENPSLNFFATGGVKDGYYPDLTSPELNYATGVSFHIPIFDGYRKKKDLLVARSNINNSVSETERIRRQVVSEVMDAFTQSESARQKISQSTRQVDQAKMALDLAQTSYKTGSITNLDLLDSETNLSESKLSLLKARVDYTISLYRVKSAIGADLIAKY